MEYEFPGSYGEAVNVPGASGVGCCATVHCSTGELQSHSLVIIGSREEVFLVGRSIMEDDVRTHVLFRLIDTEEVALRSVQPSAVPTQARILSLVAFPMHSNFIAGEHSKRTSPAATASQASKDEQTTRGASVGLQADESNEGMEEIPVATGDMIAIVIAFSVTRGEESHTYVKLLMFRASDAIATLQKVVGGGDAHYRLPQQEVYAVDCETHKVPPGVEVLRLFYFKEFSTQLERGIHVVVCSLYSENAVHSAHGMPHVTSSTTLSRVWDGHGARVVGAPSTPGLPPRSPASSTSHHPGVTSATTSQSPLLSGGGAMPSSIPSQSHNGHGRGGNASLKPMHGQLLQFRVFCESGLESREGDEEEGEVGKEEGAEEYQESVENFPRASMRPLDMSDADDADLIVPWLRRFQVSHPICSFAFQRESARAIAAVGTVNGCVYILGANRDRLIRRLSGPIADLAFVVPGSTRAMDLYHSTNTPDVPSKEHFEANGGNALAHTPSLDNITTEEERTSLIILDSIGRIIVLRAVNSGAPITQMVSDCQQLVSLEITADEDIPKASQHEETKKTFWDIKALHRFLFHRKGRATSKRTGKEANTGVSNRSFGRGSGSGATVAAVLIGHTPPSSEPKLGNSFACDLTNASLRGGSMDDYCGGQTSSSYGYVGHFLSCGLLCLGINRCPPHCHNEVVVSTMDQGVVGLPFDRTESQFVIGSYLIAPMPVFFLSFVDFFHNGTPVLVMAGLNHVFISRLTTHSLTDRSGLVELLKPAEKAPPPPAVVET